MGEIAEQLTGDKRNAEDDVYRPLAIDFTRKMEKGLEKTLFHLSQADVTQAREFINLLIDTCIEYGIATKMPLNEYSDDIKHYVRSCLKNKRCAVCGRPADLHHIDTVGIGRDRTQIDHHGMRCLPLCREHHQ